ncbi:MAG: hypothetical protein ACP5GI_08340 [Sulfolobales archaeon]
MIILSILLGVYAGFTVYFGFVILAIRNISRDRLGMLNAMASGLLECPFAEISMRFVERRRDDLRR